MTTRGDAMAKMRKGEVYEFTENYVDGTGWEFTEGTRFRVTNEQHPTSTGSSP